MKIFKSATITAIVTGALLAANAAYADHYVYPQPMTIGFTPAGHWAPSPYTATPPYRDGNYYRWRQPTRVFQPRPYYGPFPQQTAPAPTGQCDGNVHCYSDGDTWLRSPNDTFYVPPGTYPSFVRPGTYPTNTIPRPLTAPNFYAPGANLPVDENPPSLDLPHNSQPVFESPFYR